MEQHPSPVKTACCFTGHRPAGLPDGGNECTEGMFLLRRALMYAVQEAVESGITDFYAGGAQGFDLLAADAVLYVAKTHPNVRLHLALPSKTFGAGFPLSDRQRLERHLIYADSVWYAVEHGTPPYAFHARDRYMVTHADCVIAYLVKPSGGTYYTVEYAKARGLPVKNLADAAYLRPMEAPEPT